MRRLDALLLLELELRLDRLLGHLQLGGHLGEVDVPLDRVGNPRHQRDELPQKGDLAVGGVAVVFLPELGDLELGGVRSAFKQQRKPLGRRIF